MGPRATHAPLGQRPRCTGERGGFRVEREPFTERGLLWAVHLEQLERVAYSQAEKICWEGSASGGGAVLRGGVGTGRGPVALGKRAPSARECGGKDSRAGRRRRREAVEKGMDQGRRKGGQRMAQQ